MADAALMAKGEAREQLPRESLRLRLCHTVLSLNTIKELAPVCTLHHKENRCSRLGDLLENLDELEYVWVARE